MAKQNNLTGKTFLFTGTLTEMTRKEAETAVKTNGGTVLSGVSPKLNYLVAGDDAGSKLAKAKKEKTVKIISEKEFKKMVPAGVSMKQEIKEKPKMEKSLDLQTAKKVLEWEDIDLNEFKTISAEAAEALAKHDGMLQLNGLSSISDKAAEALAKYKGDLSLNGLANQKQKTTGKKINEFLAQHTKKIDDTLLTSISNMFTSQTKNLEPGEETIISIPGPVADDFINSQTEKTDEYALIEGYKIDYCNSNLEFLDKKTRNIVINTIKQNIQNKKIDPDNCIVDIEHHTQYFDVIDKLPKEHNIIFDFLKNNFHPYFYITDKRLDKESSIIYSNVIDVSYDRPEVGGIFLGDRNKKHFIRKIIIITCLKFIKKSNIAKFIKNSYGRSLEYELEDLLPYEEDSPELKLIEFIFETQSNCSIKFR